MSPKPSSSCTLLTPLRRKSPVVPPFALLPCPSSLSWGRSTGEMAVPAEYEGSFGWHQGNIVGLILLLVILIPLPITYIQWKKRHHPIMRFRLPALLFVVHWLALPICGLLDAAFYLGFPFLPCEILFWNAFTVYQFYAYPYVIRSWKLLWLFRTTRQRVAQHESNMSQTGPPTNVMGAWLTRHRWMAEDSFLMKVWGFGFVIHFLPAIILQITYKDELRFIYSPDPGVWCKELTAQFYFTVLYGFGYIVTAITLSFFLAKADDAYFMKAEYRACSSIWLFMLVMWVVWLETPTLYIRLPTYFWIAMGFIAGFFVNGYWLTYKLLTDKEETPTIEKEKEKEKEKKFPIMTSTTTTINRGDSTNSFSSVSSNVAYPGKLEDLLKNLNFRQEFCEFLVLEFCVENLMFWEEVKRWQEGDCNLQAANKIFRRFVVSGAPDQVNLTFENVEDCKKTLEGCSIENPPPRTLFDACVDEVVNIMDTDSLYRFRAFMRDKRAAARLAATGILPRSPLSSPPVTSAARVESMDKWIKMDILGEEKHGRPHSMTTLISMTSAMEDTEREEEGADESAKEVFK